MTVVEDFVGPPRSWSARIGVLLAAFAVLFGARTWLTPWVQRTFFGWTVRLDPGPALLVGHTMSWQAAHTLVVALFLILLVRFDVLKPPRLPEWGPSLRWGLGVGLALSAVTALIWIFIGPGFQVDINFWKMGGNVVSNFYEEVCYRVLLFGAGLYTFRSFLPAALISGLAFGLTHTQYPFVFRIFTAVVGMAVALSYWKSRSVLAPWLAHQVSDMLLDTFLKT